ncbi:addiction module toxin, RelE/StbE family [Fusobacterium gonidiaformans 3-1-5R]|uniref:Addiction module toxin, RelE/StbE family n=2 Tax=Fusobacterium TaxID=848 RepID=E5BE82_9FUSO|nr:addiction module toxin, RelE/StbE family [Fusobacterium gonidiaformans 3-1-5R]
MGLIMTNYKIIRTSPFDEHFKKLDNSVKILILKYLKKLENSENPKAYGKELSGNFAGLYRFRVNSYRIISKIEDDKLIIYALAVGKRSTIYSRCKI